MARWSDFEQFRNSRPRTAKGGIRAQSQRGSFGSSWWAKRWTQTLDTFGLGSRLTRGRAYARTGQVLSIEVSEGKIEARVQGSRPRPYEVRIQVQKLPKNTWERVAARAASQALYASQLLAGEMPQEMEEIFQEAGASLFPATYRDLRTDCSCPDESNPCKHIAAVYYLLGEEFDRDPFLIFSMRGMTREGFLSLLGAGLSGTRTPVPVLPPEPLPADPELFWKASVIVDEEPQEPRVVAEAALPRRLGKFPFWRGRLNFHEFLDQVYVRASAHAVEVHTEDRDRHSMG